MRKRCIRLVAAGLVFALAGCCFALGPDERPRNVVLMGWDGAQRNHVNECLARGELPNLKRLSSEGAFVEIDIRGTTDTKAGWTQILTGYDPGITGVYSNSRYQPIPRGYSVFERLEKCLGPDNIVTVAVIGKKGHVDADPPKRERFKDDEPARKGQRAKRAVPGSKIITEDGVRYRVTPGKPYYYTKDGMDVWINGLLLNEKVGTTAIGLLEKYKDKPFFFFVHFAEVDHNGHRFGENSKQYNDALISCDTWTGKIIDELKKLGIYDKTLIYVTADHGFDEGKMGHRKAPYVFLGTNDPKVCRRGDRADITPTILDRFGADLGKLEPPLNGRPLTRPAAPPPAAK
jgi:hypothetical protein